MKHLLLIMICALAFGGYSAASHAMGMQDCSSAQGAQLDECNHANADTDKDHAKKHEKGTSAKCIDCHHGCGAVVAIFQKNSLNVPSVRTVFAIDPSASHPQGRIISLLRPPRTLA